MKYPRKYTALNDKYAFVEQVSYGNTCQQLLDTLRQLSDSGYFFRGQRDALWPIVSTGQRAYVAGMKHDSRSNVGFLEFLCKALDYAKQESELVPKRSPQANRNYYDHEIWGWLQNYSYLTPLIDFSDDYFVALYMATAHITDPTISGFFSIYAMSDDYETVAIEDVINKNKAGLVESGLNYEQMFGFDNWKDFTFCLIHKDGKLKPWDTHLAEERIASQRGLFVYFNDAKMSLEAYFSKQDAMRNGEDGEGCILQKIKCFDIPNNMVLLLREVLKKRGYTERFLGLADQRKDTIMKSIKNRFMEKFPYL